MKRAPVQFPEDRSGKQYWRSLDEQAESPELQAKLAAEFPEGAAEPPDGVSRRDFFTVMGASFAMAGLAGCRRPEEKIVPYVRTPEELVLGNALYYATAIPFHGTAVGLLVESHEGRPTKIEGNPKHPDSQGAISPWVQASILELYDPDRSDTPREKGEQRTWAQAETALRNLGGTLRQRQGQGLAILTEAHRSPTLQVRLNALRAMLPGAKIVRYDAFSRANQLEGAKIAFGKAMETVYDVAQAKVLLTLDADILHSDGSVVKNAKGWAAGRAFEDPAAMSRFYAVEPTFTVTGGNADHRLRRAARDIPGFLLALASELATVHGVSLGDVGAAASEKKPKLSDTPAKWVKAVAKDLAANRGRSLVVAGSRQSAAVHALTYLINTALGCSGTTIHHVPAFDETPAGPAGIAELATQVRAGTIDTVIVLGGNPAVNAPADANFAETLKQVPTSIHLSTHYDETSQACTWHLNQAHYLESWSDVRAEDGTASIVQPLVAPLYDGKTDAELLSMLIGRPVKAYDLVRETWKPNPAWTDFDRQWRRALHDGVIDGSAYPKAPPAARPAEIAQELRRLPAPFDGVEVTFMPDSAAWDGRFGNIGWMQEWPDPVHKYTWGSVALVSKTTAKKLDVKEGQLLGLKVRDAVSTWMNVNVPVVIAPGQADDSVAVTIGKGRTFGRVAKGVGQNCGVLRTSTGFGYGPVDATKTGGHHKPARTQEHFNMEGRALVREASAVDFKKHPKMIAEMVEHTPNLSLWTEYKYEGHKWGMAIDLNTCIGCGGCMVSCQAENNIPVVGVDGVRRTREMHWIRVDRYFQGPVEDPSSVTQPMTCQQCENAPCETVCPVGATTHSPEGLNDMAYNRCIGTRYCANNCPWKVRRFNYFHYNKNHSETRKMQFNPDVTVRSRGVMEKCTWCVQRINRAKIVAHRAGTEDIKDGTINPACAQACPTNAITFGDLNDPNAKVTKLVTTDRAYKQLEMLNVRARLSYMAKIRNPNPELAAS